MNELLKRKRKGAAVPLAMVAVMILLAMGVGLLSLGRNARVYAARTSSAIAARSAADSGLVMAMLEMNEQLQAKSLDDEALPAAQETLPHSDLTFSYAVTRDAGGGYSIESTGIAGGIEKVVGCALEFKGPFEYALFADGGMELKNSAIVDWYNNEEGDALMQVGTNSIAAGAVTLKNSAYINGNVVVGMGGDPDVAVSNSGDIEGSILVSSEEHQLPEIAAPDWLQTLPSEGTIQNDITISSSAKYSDINLKSKKTMKIEGDVALYIAGDLILGNSATIEIAEGSSLVLYLGGDLECKNSSEINNNTEDAKKLQVYGLNTCKAMDFKNGSEIYGTIYAPNADVVMFNSDNVYGAIVAKTLELKNSGEFLYDASLRDVGQDEAIGFEMTNWYEK